jgi:hypothetical protein
MRSATPRRSTLISAGSADSLYDGDFPVSGGWPASGPRVIAPPHLRRRGAAPPTTAFDLAGRRQYVTRDPSKRGSAHGRCLQRRHSERLAARARADRHGRHRQSGPRLRYRRLRRQGDLLHLGSGRARARARAAACGSGAGGARRAGCSAGDGGADRRAPSWERRGGRHTATAAAGRTRPRARRSSTESRRARCRRHHRRRLGQGRGGKVHRRRQPCARPAGARAQDRRARC